VARRGGWGAVLLVLLLLTVGAAVGSLVPWWLPIARPGAEALDAAVVQLHPAPEQIDTPGGLGTVSATVPYGGYQQAQGDPEELLARSRERASAAGWSLVEEHPSHVVVQRDGMRATLRGHSLQVWPWVPSQLPATLLGGLTGLGCAVLLIRRGVRLPRSLKPLAFGLLPLAASVALTNATRNVPPVPYGDELLSTAMWIWPLWVGPVAAAYVIAGAALAIRAQRAKRMG